MDMKRKKEVCAGVAAEQKEKSQSYAIKCLKKNKMTYAFLIPAIVFTIIFCYIPLGGLYMAFVDYNPFKGIFGSPFVGLENIKTIFSMPALYGSILNTIWLSLLRMCVNFPLPIIFALLLNEVKNQKFKRITQTVSYLPHFLSSIAVVGIATTIYSSSGIINDIRAMIYGPDVQRILFLGQQNFFVPNIVILTAWQGLGWGTIIYLSAISGIDPELYEAAVIDGAGKFKQCWHITLPSISITIMLLFVLEIGNLLASNFDLIYGLQNPYINFEVISTVVYKQGITQGNYPVATAFSFINGLISLVLILIGNFISKKINDVSLI
ncbi:MAG: sugar ABC transporter permease [Ruminococcaceae bacterium]|nr:sugar ABC transporter permease [Oscillospiraceae bacterium]